MPCAPSSAGTAAPQGVGAIAAFERDDRTATVGSAPQRPGMRFAATDPGSPMQGDDGRPIVPGIVIEPFGPGRHDRSGFSCGTGRLDNFLRFTARKQQKDDFTRVFVAVAEGSPEVLGYYALNAHAVATADLGADLAVDALGRARSVADEVGLKLVVLDVIDDGGGEVFARRGEFYRRLGFQSFRDRPDRMFITIDTIRAMFGDG